MSKRHNLVRNAVQAGVRGTRTIAFGGVPFPVESNAINRAWDEKLKKIRNKREGSAQDAPGPDALSWRSVFGLPG